MSKINLIIFSFLYCFCLPAQHKQTVSILFKPVFGTAPLYKDSAYVSQKAGRVTVETMKLYISAVAFLKNDSLVYREENSFHLLDADKPESLLLTMHLPAKSHYNTVTFNIGIDSLTNVSGVMGGSLDPANGMYWTWESGYINTKLEGRCSSCPSAKKEFQFHLGGYQSPFNPLQTKTLAVNDTGNIVIYIDPAHFFNTADVMRRDHVMSPCADGVLLSEIMRDCFFIAGKK